MLPGTVATVVCANPVPKCLKCSAPTAQSYGFPAIAYCHTKMGCDTCSGGGAYQEAWEGKGKIFSHSPLQAPQLAVGVFRPVPGLWSKRTCWLAPEGIASGASDPLQVHSLFPTHPFLSITPSLCPVIPTLLTHLHCWLLRYPVTTCKASMASPAVFQKHTAPFGSKAPFATARKGVSPPDS